MNDKDKTSLRFRFLSDVELRESILNFIARVLSFPKFDQDILEREKNIAISRLQDSLTKPQSIALRNLWKSMYPDHPYVPFPDPDPSSSGFSFTTNVKPI